MKRMIVVFVVLVVAAGLVFALRPGLWPDNKRPRLDLGDAYQCALVALGSATNQFYCVCASCQLPRPADGEWMFSFFSTNGLAKHAFVSFDKTTRVHDGILRY
jgi:hypothetical protein